MDLYVVRHGVAQKRGAAGVVDSERGLTAKGVTRTRLAAQGLRALGCRPECVLSSPLRRAWQTAAILCETLSPQLEAEACDLLRPGSSIAELIGWLAGRKDRSIVLVGHMPDAAELIAALVGAPEDADIGLGKAGACLVSVDGKPAPGSGRLEWLLRPGQLRALAGREDD
jgi:phosphohistidine phosphatase